MCPGEHLLPVRDFRSSKAIIESRNCHAISARYSRVCEKTPRAMASLRVAGGSFALRIIRLIVKATEASCEPQKPRVKGITAKTTTPGGMETAETAEGRQRRIRPARRRTGADAGDSELALINRLIAAFHGSQTLEKLFHPLQPPPFPAVRFASGFPSQLVRVENARCARKATYAVYARFFMKETRKMPTRFRCHTLTPLSLRPFFFCEREP